MGNGLILCKLAQLLIDSSYALLASAMPGQADAAHPDQQEITRETLWGLLGRDASCTTSGMASGGWNTPGWAIASASVLLVVKSGASCLR